MDEAHVPEEHKLLRCAATEMSIDKSTFQQNIQQQEWCPLILILQIILTNFRELLF